MKDKKFDKLMEEVSDVMDRVMKAPKIPATKDTPDHVCWLLGIKSYYVKQLEKRKKKKDGMEKLR